MAKDSQPARLGMFQLLFGPRKQYKKGHMGDDLSIYYDNELKCFVEKGKEHLAVAGGIPPPPPPKRPDSQNKSNSIDSARPVLTGTASRYAPTAGVNVARSSATGGPALARVSLNGAVPQRSSTAPNFFVPQPPSTEASDAMSDQQSGTPPAMFVPGAEASQSPTANGFHAAENGADSNGHVRSENGVPRSPKQGTSPVYAQLMSNAAAGIRQGNTEPSPRLNLEPTAEESSDMAPLGSNISIDPDHFSGRGGADSAVGAAEAGWNEMGDNGFGEQAMYEYGAGQPVDGGDDQAYDGHEAYDYGSQPVVEDGVYEYGGQMSDGLDMNGEHQHGVQAVDGLDSQEYPVEEGYYGDQVPVEGQEYQGDPEYGAYDYGAIEPGQEMVNGDGGSMVDHYALQDYNAWDNRAWEDLFTTSPQFFYYHFYQARILDGWGDEEWAQYGEDEPDHYQWLAYYMQIWEAELAGIAVEPMVGDEAVYGNDGEFENTGDSQNMDHAGGMQVILEGGTPAESPAFSEDEDNALPEPAEAGITADECAPQNVQALDTSDVSPDFEMNGFNGYNDDHENNRPSMSLAEQYQNAAEADVPRVHDVSPHQEGFGADMMVHRATEWNDPESSAHQRVLAHAANVWVDPPDDFSNTMIRRHDNMVAELEQEYSDDMLDFASSNGELDREASTCGHSTLEVFVPEQAPSVDGMSTELNVSTQLFGGSQGSVTEHMILNDQARSEIKENGQNWAQRESSFNNGAFEAHGIDAQDGGGSENGAGSSVYGQSPSLHAPSEIQSEVHEEHGGGASAHLPPMLSSVIPEAAQDELGPMNEPHEPCILPDMHREVEPTDRPGFTIDDVERAGRGKRLVTHTMSVDVEIASTAAISENGSQHDTRASYCSGSERPPQPAVTIAVDLPQDECDQLDHATPRQDSQANNARQSDGKRGGVNAHLEQGGGLQNLGQILGLLVDLNDAVGIAVSSPRIDPELQEQFRSFGNYNAALLDYMQGSKAVSLQQQQPLESPQDAGVHLLTPPQSRISTPQKDTKDSSWHRYTVVSPPTGSAASTPGRFSPNLVGLPGSTLGMSGLHHPPFGMETAGPEPTSDAYAQITSLQQQLETVRSDIADLSQQNARLQQERDEANSQLEQRDETILSLSTQIQTMQVQLEEAREQAASSSGHEQIADLQAALADQQDDFAEMMSCLGQESAKVDALCLQLGQYGVDVDALMDEIEEQMGYGMEGEGSPGDGSQELSGVDIDLGEMPGEVPSNAMPADYGAEDCGMGDYAAGDGLV